eukprot:s2455_g2.t1
MSASYDCCGNCGHERLQSEKAIWLLGIWRGLLLGVLHAFQSFTNDLLVATGRNHKEAGSVVAVNQMIALLLMPLVAFSGYFVGLRIMLVVISLLPFFGTLALLAAPSLLLEAGLLAIAVAATVMPVLPLVLVPANSRSCGKSFGLLDSLYGLGQATVTVAIGALREEGGFEAALPFLAAAFASAALLSVWVAHVASSPGVTTLDPEFASDSNHAALWSIVIYMARQQDSQIDAALGMTSQPARASGFGKFLQHSSWCTSSEAQQQFWKLTDEELGALLSDEVLPWQLAPGPFWGEGQDLPGLGV